MKRKIVTSLLALLVVIEASAQNTKIYLPWESNPFRPTLVNILLYIVSPVALIVFYFLYRRAKWEKRRKGRYPVNVFS